MNVMWDESALIHSVANPHPGSIMWKTCFNSKWKAQIQFFQRISNTQINNWLMQLIWKPLKEYSKSIANMLYS